MPTLEPHWIENGKAFWYRHEATDGTGSFLRVSSATGEKSPLFDEKKLAAALSKASGQAVDPAKLPFRTLTLEGKKLQFEAMSQNWSVNLDTFLVEKLAPTKRKFTPPELWI